MILSIDTFSEVLGLALLDRENKVRFFVNYYKPKPFSESIITEIDRLFKEFEINKKDLKAIAVNKGPGAYTGLRIGITAAKIISYALSIDIYSYESLYTMAYRYKHFNGRIISTIYAGKGEVYIRKFISDGKDLKPLTENLLIKKKELDKYIDKDALIIQKNLNDLLQNAKALNTSLALDGLFLSLEKNLKENPFTLEPVYLRKA